MADDRNLWALRRATSAQRRSENALKQSDLAISNARDALEWMCVRLEELREKRHADGQAIPQPARSPRPRHVPRALR